MILYELFKGLPHVFYVIEVFMTLYIAHEAHLSPPEVTEVSCIFILFFIILYVLYICTQY